MRTERGNDVIIMLVGNKTDLQDKRCWSRIIDLTNFRLISRISSKTFVSSVFQTAQTSLQRGRREEGEGAERDVYRDER